MAMATAMVMAAMAMMAAAVATAVVTTVATVMAVEVGPEAMIPDDQLSALAAEDGSCRAVSRRKKGCPEKLEKLYSTTSTKAKAPPKDMLTS